MAQLLRLPRPASLTDPGLIQLLDALDRGDPWREMVYNEFTDATITATTEATANTVATADSLDTDGKPILIEFCTPRMDRGTNVITLYLYDAANGAAAASIGILAESTLAGASPGGTWKRRLAPTVGRHVYSVRASVDAGTGAVFGGTGGTGQRVPGFIRISRA